MDVSLPNAVVQEVRERGVGRERYSGIIAGAWQDRARRQADGLCLHRPAMLLPVTEPAALVEAVKEARRVLVT